MKRNEPVPDIVSAGYSECDDEQNFICESCSEQLPIEDISINLMSGMICTGCELKPLDSYMMEDR